MEYTFLWLVFVMRHRATHAQSQTTTYYCIARWHICPTNTSLVECLFATKPWSEMSNCTVHLMQFSIPNDQTPQKGTMALPAGLNVVFLVGLSLLFIGTLLHIIGQSTPEWLVPKTSSSGSLGLWEVCSQGVCVTYPKDSKPGNCVMCYNSQRLEEW